MDASRPPEGLVDLQIVQSVGGSGDTCLVGSRASENRAGYFSGGCGGVGGGRGERHAAAHAAWPASTPPSTPPKRHHSIASEAGAGCGFVGQAAPVATKYRRGREARRASICGRQPRRERTRFHRDIDEFQAQDLYSDRSSTANSSTIIRCQYPKLVRIRSGSAETEKTGRFSRHRETPRRILSLQHPLSVILFSLSIHATETSSVASRGQTMSGTAGKTLSSYA